MLCFTVSELECTKVCGLSCIAVFPGCGWYKYTCANKDCFSRGWTCSGISSCGDNSDEVNCTREYIPLCLVYLVHRYTVSSHLTLKVERMPLGLFVTALLILQPYHTDVHCTHQCHLCRSSNLRHWETYNNSLCRRGDDKNVGRDKNILDDFTPEVTPSTHTGPV